MAESEDNSISLGLIKSYEESMSGDSSRDLPKGQSMSGDSDTDRPRPKMSDVGGAYHSEPKPKMSDVGGAYQ